MRTRQPKNWYSTALKGNIQRMICPLYNATSPVYLMPWEKTLAVTLYSLIAAVAIIGNSFVIFVIFYFRRMRTVTNLFIANLAVSDIFMAVMCIPFSYWPVLILGNWPFGWAMCKTISFVKVVAVMLSAHTLVVISFDRFAAISSPLKKPMPWKLALILLVGTWTTDFGIAFPVLIVQTLKEHNFSVIINGSVHYENVIYCSEDWGSELGSILYSTLIMVLQYFLPLLILVLCYLGIGIKVWIAVSPGEIDVRSQSKRRALKRKAVFMMFLVSTMFAACWLPQNTLNVLVSTCMSYLRHPRILHIWWGCHFSAMCQSCLNPFIYLATSQRFREGYKFLFRCCPCVKYQPRELLTYSQSVKASVYRSLNSRKLTFSSSLDIVQLPPTPLGTPQSISRSLAPMVVMDGPMRVSRRRKAWAMSNRSSVQCV